jgi:hypothetical protein
MMCWQLIPNIMQFTLTCRDEDGTITEKRFDGVFLDDVVSKVQDFLHGVGFVFEELEIINSYSDEKTSWVDFITETEDKVAQVH